jgi:hypothetical protein
MFCASALFCANALAGATNALAHRVQDKQDPIGAVIGNQQIIMSSGAVIEMV